MIIHRALRPIHKLEPLFAWLPCGTGNWWGTMIANTSTYYPSPWISDSGGGIVNHNPGIIWYWVH